MSALVNTIRGTFLQKKKCPENKSISTIRGIHSVRCCSSSGNNRRHVVDQRQRRRQVEQYNHDDDGLVSTAPTETTNVVTAAKETHGMSLVVDADQSWSVWNEYFMDMDEIVRELHGLDDDIKVAVKREEYGKAAALKREQEILESQDTVLQIQKDLECAIREERYSDAAVLRDDGGVRLLGWWIGKEGSHDAQGHIVAITRDFSRYVAHAFTGYTLARAVGWTNESSSPEISLDTVMMSSQEDEDEDDEDPGTPVFEVFYRRDEDVRGWKYQAAVFNSPVETISSGNVVSIEHGTDEDGTDFVKINLAGCTDDIDGVDVDDDDIQTVEDLVNSLESDDDIVEEEEEDDDDETATEELISALSGMSHILSKRVPADIEWIDRDSFSLVVDEIKQKEIVHNMGLASQQETAEQQLQQQQPETLKEIETMVKAALASADPTINIIDDVQERSSEPMSSIAGLEGRVTYTRLVAPSVTTDVFQGLYLGSFGPHGPEIVEIKRVKIDGQEWVQGVKITGDINVPAGEVSFKARVGRENRLSPDGVYPIEYGVQARYPGQGRVAREGYTSPKWVDGELLTLTKSNALTRGAEVGFVFHVDASKKFLLLFERIDDSIFSSSSSSS